MAGMLPFVVWLPRLEKHPEPSHSSTRPSPIYVVPGGSSGDRSREGDILWVAGGPGGQEW